MNGDAAKTQVFRWSEISPDPNDPRVLRERAHTIQRAHRSPVASRIDYLCGLAAGLDVLDVGVVEHFADNETSRRWLHRHLAEAARTCVGLDILTDEVDALRAKGYDVRVHDLVASPLDATFDIVVAGELIEHLDQPGRFLENVRSMLRPGGRLVLTTPNPYMVHRAWKHMRGQFPDSADHALLLGPGQVVELAARAGLALAAWRGILLKDMAGPRNRAIAGTRRALSRTLMAPEIRCDSLIYELAVAS